MTLYRRYALIEDGRDRWRIWDLRLERWCGKFLETDRDYYAATREVAAMRVRDAHQWAKTESTEGVKET